MKVTFPILFYLTIILNWFLLWQNGQLQRRIEIRDALLQGAALLMDDYSLLYNTKHN